MEKMIMEGEARGEIAREEKKVWLVFLCLEGGRGNVEALVTFFQTSSSSNPFFFLLHPPKFLLCLALSPPPPGWKPRVVRRVLIAVIKRTKASKENYSGWGVEIKSVVFFFFFFFKSKIFYQPQNCSPQ